MRRFFLLIYFFCCFVYSQDNLIIELDKQQNDSLVNFDRFTEFWLESLDKYPKFKKNIIETYKGIPICDSIDFYFRQDSRIGSFYEFYKHGDIGKEEFLSYLEYSNVSFKKLDKIKLTDNLVFLIAFAKNKQLILADVNRNKDFSDDIVYEFDIKFRLEPLKYNSLLKDLPISKYIYEDYDNGKLVKYEREFILYPFRNHPGMYNFDKKQVEYLSIFRYTNNWKGSKKIDTSEYDFYFNGEKSNYGVLYIKPRIVSFHPADELYNTQFQYSLKDTVTLGNFRYKLDSIDRSISKIYLSKVSNNFSNYGTSVGTKIKDFEFEDLDNHTLRLNTILSQKKYTLLEFWGTWCAPCIEITPKLKSFYNQYSGLFNIIGIAVDDSKEKVKSYVLNNNLNWTIGFVQIQRTFKKKFLLKDLQIQGYPTFILLDAEGKIIIRGSVESLNDILDVISRSN